MPQAPPTDVFYWMTPLSVSKFAFLIRSPSPSAYFDSIRAKHCRPRYTSRKHFETTLFMAIENFIFKQVLFCYLSLNLVRLKGKQEQSLTLSPR